VSNEVICGFSTAEASSYSTEDVTGGANQSGKAKKAKAKKF
jgi:hypothetical protein